MPYFPPDSYGFSHRTFSWGMSGSITCSTCRYFVPRDLSSATAAALHGIELSHMHDVKWGAKLLKIWYAVVCLDPDRAVAWRGEMAARLHPGLRQGGWLTLALALTIALLPDRRERIRRSVLAILQDFMGCSFAFVVVRFRYIDPPISVQFWQDACYTSELFLRYAGLRLGSRPTVSHRVNFTSGKDLAKRARTGKAAICQS